MRPQLRAAWILTALALAVRPAPARVDIVAIVSAKSSVQTLTTPQVADIFLGKSSRFPDGAKAVPLDQPEGSAARDEFYATFAGKSAAQMKAHWSKIIFTGRGQPPDEVPDSAAARKRVAEDPNAIAYIERTLADDSVRVVAP
ncbi:MAG: phosphate ABC transporter substrate-binding protein [Thermoanaerobaculia bacterium]